MRSIRPATADDQLSAGQKPATEGRLGKTQAAFQLELDAEPVWALREAMQSVTRVEKLRKCGRTRVGPNVGVHFAGTGHAGYAGVTTCGSVWACTRCASKIVARRRAELGTALSRWTKQGHGVVFLTLTARHHKGQTLDQVWSAIAAGWRRVCSGGSWVGTATSVGIKAQYGIRYWARFIEVTHGRHGWHVHAHIALLTDDVLTRAQAHQLEVRLYERWSKGLQSNGFDATSKNGVDVRVAGGLDAPKAIAKYLTKSGLDGLAAELTNGQVKEAKRGNRTPFQVLGSIRGALLAGQRPNRSDVRIWREWEAGASGRRQMGLSKGFRDDLIKSAEQSDDEIAAEVGAGFVVGSVDAEGWRQLMRCGGRYEVVAAARAAETPDAAQTAVAAALDRLGIPFTPLMNEVAASKPLDKQTHKVRHRARRSREEVRAGLIDLLTPKSHDDDLRARAARVSEAIRHELSTTT